MNYAEEIRRLAEEKGALILVHNYESAEVQDVADYDTLYEMCKKACADANSIYHKVQIATAIQPISTYMSTIQLHQYQVNDKYSCTSFVIHLETGGSLEMNLRKIISIV